MIAELGRGGMGRVLLGCAPDGRLVALKQVHPQFAHDDGFRARFRREVAASRKVSGAYTAAVIDADVDAPTPWLASVFVPGPSLREVVDALGGLPAESARRLAAGLATALIEIHRAGLVHRDLKPSNVLLAEDGPRVIDFGIARATDDGGSELTGAGWLVGSPGYMSPEQVVGRPVTPASDVFCLGAVLAMACTRRDPFTGPATMDILDNVVRAEPDLRAVPERLREVVRWCLAKDPARRPTPAQLLVSLGEIPPSAQTWPPAVHQLIARQHADLRGLLDETGERHTLVAAGPSTIVGTMSLSSTPVPSRRARRRVAIAAGVVAAAAAAVVLVSTHGGGPGTAAADTPGRAATTTPHPTSAPAGPASTFATSLRPADLPPGYALCATEGQVCAPNGTRVMAFGAGTYSYALINGPTLCSDATFGHTDPAKGLLKSCYLAPNGGPAGYRYCATEGDTCKVDGTQEVAFGANGAFRFQSVTTSVACTSGAFGGDPLNGAPGRCYIAPNGPPGGWTRCAAENGTCDLTGVQPLAYGANGAYWFGKSDGNTSCSIGTLGVDPAYGINKNCYSWTGPPPGYSNECAAEYRACSFTGKETVAFGADGDYVYATFTGGTPCTATAFGTDPLPYVTKACYLTR
jgi:hypothetical protein